MQESLCRAMDFARQPVFLPSLTQAVTTDWQATFDSVPFPLLLLDAEARIVRANQAGASLLLARELVPGRPYTSLHDPENHGEQNSPVRAAFTTKQTRATEIFDARGQRWIREIINPILDASQNLNGAILAVEDITECKLQEESLRQALTQVERLKERLRTETDYLKADFKVAHAHQAILGQSEAIRKALHQVEQVAPTDASVLLCGETGTGKELFAEALHGLSARKDRMIVKVNCAALPQPLVESELFGREKGAYTGALARQEGRFELADNSSIFLDEIGELTLEIQAKLLRVLQEGQFERLGSPRTMKVNVRLIAATNRDLAEEVRKGRFRQDLYYRLNVFPIKIPPLRERVEDVPLLVWSFVEEFSTRMGKKITNIPRKTMETLEHYVWPGNIRELRNVIERSVIITSGETLRIAQFDELEQTRQPMTLCEMEREHITRTLEKSFWHIKGPNGAARRLGMKPSTLYTRMQKLGIPNRRQKDLMAA